MERAELDDADKRILALLNEDARRPDGEIASEVGLSTDEVASRIDRLQDKGIITMFTTILDTAKLGYISVAFGFSVEPGKTDKIASELSECDNVYKLWILSGRHNLIAHANFNGITEFQDFSSNVLHSIDGITNYESSIVTKSVLHEGSVVLSDIDS